ncbi:hypothetical protein Taro_002301 [Colocasia esculenta]|uniref:DUF3741 domain-containing protein n=1 Tax=Colocasia esculenta TaxID=4460 RepID=A0A843TKI1_COLES|nr:hypothetical protein [Colocasia esculenta]
MPPLRGFGCGRVDPEPNQSKKPRQQPKPKEDAPVLNGRDIEAFLCWVGFRNYLPCDTRPASRNQSVYCSLRFQRGGEGSERNRKMSAKLLNSFTDENPDLHKQIGCMTGIFQMFDRHQLLTGRRHRKRLPSGDDALSDSHLRAEASSVTSQIVLEKNLSKSMNENQRVSVESSRTSFSSSSCSSSFSSLECNKSTQQEPSFDRTTIPERPLKNTTVESSDIDSRPPPSSPHLYPQNLSSPSCRQPLDFRDIVKDSIHRDNHSLSIKTSKKGENKGEVKKHVLKHKDSPRPLSLPETTHGSYLSSKNAKPKMSEDLNRSARVLAKLKEAPRHFSENRPVKLSHEAKDGSFFPMAREAPRFSYDGRETSRSSVDSREQSKCSTRPRELPRLSLDSRKSSMSSNFDSKTNTLMNDLESVEANQNIYRSLTLEQDLETHRQPTSVVARLMGLEAMPSSSGMQGNLDVGEGSITDSNTSHNLEAITPSSKSLKITGESKEERRSCSPKSSIKVLAVPQSRSVKPTTKSVPNSRIPIETAPWKQGRSQGKTQQMAFGCREGHVRQQHESVYSEIGRKLKELEFQQSNKDLRALKQILDAIQAKGQLESNRDESPSSEVSYKKSNRNKAVIGIRQNLKTASRQDPHTSRQDTTLMKGFNTPRPLEAPIVIMKPAKFINKSNVSATSSIPFDGLSRLPKVPTGDDSDVKKIPANNCLDKEETLRVDLMEPAIQILLSPSKDSGRHREKSCSQKAHVQIGQVSPRLQQPIREISGSITKASGSVSPRQQQKKIELEKKSRPPVPSYESTKSKNQFSTRHISESVSPRSRVQSKSEQMQKNNDKLGRNRSDTRNLRNHTHEVSLRTESIASLALQMDMEVTSIDQSVDLISDSGSSSNSAVSNISSIRKEKVIVYGTATTSPHKQKASNTAMAKA